jgi:hypothetical protein
MERVHMDEAADQCRAEERDYICLLNQLCRSFLVFSNKILYIYIDTIHQLE